MILVARENYIKSERFFWGTSDQENGNQRAHCSGHANRRNNDVPASLIGPPASALMSS